MGQGVTTALLKAGSQLQQQSRVLGPHAGHQRASEGEGAGLVEHNAIEAGGGFDHIAAAKQPAPLRRQTGGHGDHGGGGQAKGAGTGHHQHSDRQLQRQPDRGGGTTAEATVVHRMAAGHQMPLGHARC